MSGGDVNSCGSFCVDVARLEMSNSSLSGLLTFGAGALVSLAARAGARATGEAWENASRQVWFSSRIPAGGAGSALCYGGHAVNT